MLRTILAVSLLACSLDLAAAITGHVVDDDGKPIAGARVRAVALESPEAQSSRLASATPEPVPIGEATTNDAGAFRVETKRQPVVTLLVEAAGRAGLSRDVVDGEDAGAFLLRAGTMKQGRVTASGKPVANALVVVNSGYFLTRTNEAGEYSIADPAGWLTRLTVLHPDYAMAERNRTRDVAPALDVTLESGVVARGRVVDASGRPIAGAIISNGPWAVGKSGEDGSFTIAHLPATVKTLSAREGKRVGSANVGAQTLVLGPGGTVTGSVRSSKDETPIAGMKLSLRGDAFAAYAPMTVSDAKGNFAFDGVAAGIQQLGMSHPAFAGTGQTEVLVPEGGSVDRALTAAPLARLAGTVVDEQKKPVGGARINFTGGGWNTITAPDGTFTMRFQTFDRGSIAEVTKAGYAGAAYGPLRVEPGEVRSNVRIVLARGAKFEIRLIDPEGIAIVDEPVVITRRLDANDRGQTVAVRCGSMEAQGCRSDTEGKLTVNLVESAYDVRAGGQTTVEKLLSGQTLTAADSPLTIELERGATIEGRLVWSDGSPVTTPAFVQTDAGRGAGAPAVDGAFTLRNVRAGKVILTPQTGPPNFVNGDPVEVTAPATGVVLKLTRPGRIEGRVVERDSQRAVTQFSVAAEQRAGARRGPSRKSFTADDGKFVLDDVAPGSVDVIVHAPGFVRSTTSAVEVQEGEATKIDVSLERAGTVVGRVSSGGRAVADAMVNTATEQRGRMRDAQQTDANGDYVIDTLAAGSHELTVRKNGYVPKTITVNVAVGKEVRGDVELSRGRELQGRVSDSSGRPVAAAEVMTGGSGGRVNFNSRVSSDADGNFRLDGLADTPITVIARKAGYADGAVEVNPSTTTSVSITLERGGTISGRVTGLPPAELQGVEVYAMPIRRTAGPGGQVLASVDANGAFTLVGVPDGEVRISAQQIRPPRRQVTANPITVAGGTGPFVELDFAAGVVVRGKVTRRGQVASRGMVIFVPADPRERSRQGTSELQPDGSYELRVGGPGVYEVMVSLQETAIGTTRLGNLEVRGEMQHDIDIRGAAIRARIVDGASGVPLPDVRVMLIGVGRGGTDRTTDSSGRVIFDFVADGSYSLRPTKQGYAAPPRDVVVQNGADVEVEVAISRGEEVVVRFIDAATGGIAPNTFGAIVDGAGRTVADRPSLTDSTGGMHYWLTPGNYTLRVSSREYEPRTMPLVVPGTPEVRVELVKRR